VLEWKLVLTSLSARESAQGVLRWGSQDAVTIAFTSLPVDSGARRGAAKPGQLRPTAAKPDRSSCGSQAGGSGVFEGSAMCSARLGLQAPLLPRPLNPGGSLATLQPRLQASMNRANGLTPLLTGVFCDHGDQIDCNAVTQSLAPQSNQRGTPRSQ